MTHPKHTPGIYKHTLGLYKPYLSIHQVYICRTKHIPDLYKPCQAHSRFTEAMSSTPYVAASRTKHTSGRHKP